MLNLYNHHNKEKLKIYYNSSKIIIFLIMINITEQILDLINDKINIKTYASIILTQWIKLIIHIAYITIYARCGEGCLQTLRR